MNRLETLVSSAIKARPSNSSGIFRRPKGILKTLVAFANTASGTVVIGVEDGSKNVCGVPDVLAAEEKLASFVTDSIVPRLVPDIEVVAWRNLNVLTVQVYPSNTRPHYLHRLGSASGVLVRVGSTNRKAEALQIEDLRRWNRMDSFDEQAIPDLKSEAIDFRVASEFLSQYRPVTSQAWNTLRITTQHQGRQVPTISGWLLFGKDRFARFPDAWIQAGRFAGSTRTQLIDSIEIRSLLPRTAEEAVAFARKHLTHESVIEGVRREERWSVPLVAIREALRNAIVHADYAQQGVGRRRGKSFCAAIGNCLWPRTSSPWKCGPGEGCSGSWCCSLSSYRPARLKLRASRRKRADGG